MKIHAFKFADRSATIAASRSDALSNLSKAISEADPNKGGNDGELALHEINFPGVSASAAVVTAYKVGLLVGLEDDHLRVVADALAALATDKVTTKRTVVGFVKDGQVFASGVKLPAVVGQAFAIPEVAEEGDAAAPEVEAPEIDETLPPAATPPVPPAAVTPPPAAPVPPSMPANPFEPAR